MRLLKIMSGTVVTNLDGCVNQAFMLLLAAGLLSVCLQVRLTALALLKRCRMLEHITPVLKSPTCCLGVKHRVFKISLLVCEALDGLGPKYTCTVWNAWTPQEEAYSVFSGPQTNKMKQLLVTTILFRPSNTLYILLIFKKKML